MNPATTKAPIKIRLVDAYQMSLDHPETFEYPHEKDVVSLVPGQHVKVCNRQERFWVMLTQVTAPKLVGTIANDLLDTKRGKYRFGTAIEFNVKHLYQVGPKPKKTRKAAKKAQ